MKKITFTLLVSIICFSFNAQPLGWSDGFIGFGFANHIVAIQSTAQIIIDNGTISTSDYIGAFYDSSGIQKCGGFTEWTGATIAVTVWADDPMVTGKLGFDENEHMYWKVWRASDSVTIDMTARYNINAMTPDSLFVTNGLSEITLLSGNAPTASVSLMEDLEIKMFPNPVVDQLTVSSLHSDKLIKEVVFFNLLGKSMKSFNNINNRFIEIDLSDFPSGNYFIKINDQLVRKVVIE